MMTMQDSIDYLIKLYHNYVGSGHVVILFFVSLIFIFLYKDTFLKNSFLYTATFIIIMFIVNPIIFNIVQIFLGKTAYWRTYWLLFDVFIISIVATVIITNIPKRTKKIIASFALCMVFILSGTLILQQSPSMYSSSENLFKISNETIAVADTILELAITRDEHVLVDPDTAIEIRQYTSDITLVYGREFLTNGNVRNTPYENHNENATILYNMLYTTQAPLDEDLLGDAAKAVSCKYIVVPLSSGTLINSLNSMNVIDLVALTTLSAIYEVM